MAKLYILTDDQIKSGKRHKTSRDKLKDWRKICFVLTALVIIEHVLLYHHMVK